MDFLIPDESKALSLLAPANAVAGLLPGGGLLPTPNPMPSIGGVPLGLGGPNLDPMAALALAARRIFTHTDGSNKEIEEAMKRVREAQSLISAAIEPGICCERRRSKSRSRRRSRSRSRRRSKSPRRRKSRSRDRSRRSRSSCALRASPASEFCGSVPQVTRDYDEEEQGYDSEHEEEHERNSDAASSPQAKEPLADSADDAGRGESDGNSEDQQDEDMDMSD
uniref:Serine/arginine-rich splicing factor 11-like n=1 Tax=Sinocyclocheilus grahami TaxID=75366 RepID=A0A672NU67_SINGR